MHEQMSELIRGYINERKSARLEKFDKETVKQRKVKGKDEVNASELEPDLAAKRANEETKFEPHNWLTDAAKRAGQIRLATHAIKFTHTDARGTSLYIQKSCEVREFEDRYLSTSSLVNPRIDVVGNAAALDVAGLLQLEVSGISLISMISQDDGAALSPFAQDKDQLASWMSAFKEALSDKELSSHKLAKQVYFPVSEGQYHLISPLYASSLSHALYERIAHSRYSEPAKIARKAKKEGKYSATSIIDFIDTAIQAFGGTKPQNVSQLNSSRSGKSFLLSCKPPLWKTQVRPPDQNKNSFWKAYDRRAWRTARELKDFLIKNLEKDSTKSFRDHVSNLIDDLISILFNYAAEIQSLKELAGWSTNSKLSVAEQLWLDPLREDPAFKKQREANEWQGEVAKQFASWLIHKVKDDKLLFTDAHYIEWSKILERKLILMKDDLEV